MLIWLVLFFLALILLVRLRHRLQVAKVSVVDDRGVQPPRALVLVVRLFVIVQALLLLPSGASTASARSARQRTSVQAGDVQRIVGEQVTTWLMEGSRKARTGSSIHQYDGPSTCMATPELIATKTGTGRGLSDLGGVIEQTGTNAAGGRIFTSTGTIAQKDFQSIVQGGLMRGDEVHILTGAHGTASGGLIADAGMLADDLERFGSMPGVHVHDVSSMTSAQIQAIMRGKGTIIGGFCNSGVCLAPHG